MVCELLDEAWSALLDARRILDAGAVSIAFVKRGADWWCVPGDAVPDDGDQLLLCDGSIGGLGTDRRCTLLTTHRGGPPTVTHPYDRPIDVAMQAIARVYLPVLLGAATARREGRVFVAAHVTQTLDGRIACTNGQSQWIGNDADQRHSHRMRALLQGVLVGANTVLQDDPQLTVRHVHGDHPRRLVLSGCGRALRAPARKVYDAPGSLAIIARGTNAVAPTEHVDIVEVDRNGDTTLAPAAILAVLRDQGIHSIYVEGGATTVSSFLRANAIDLLQVHVAAMLLGSGLSSFSLPEVEHVDQGTHLRMDHVTLDGHLLLTCWPR